MVRSRLSRIALLMIAAVAMLAIAPQGGPGRALVYGLGCVATGSLLLLYNATITGDAFL